MEFDPTHDALDISALPSDMSAAVHGPLCYMSTGQICEFASIGSSEEESFRPNGTCSMQCQNTSIRYTGASGVEFIKAGRSIFFQQKRVSIRGVGCYRLVYSPLFKMLGLR